MKIFHWILAIAVLSTGTLLVAQDNAEKQPPQDGVYQIGHGVSVPRKISGVEPQFNNKARKEKLQGTVTLKVVVTPAGTTRDISVIKSLGSGLDQKAIDAVSTWKFQPAMKDGQPVAVRLYIQVDFKLY